MDSGRSTFSQMEDISAQYSHFLVFVFFHMCNLSLQLSILFSILYWKLGRYAYFVILNRSMNILFQSQPSIKGKSVIHLLIEVGGQGVSEISFWYTILLVVRFFFAVLLNMMYVSLVSMRLIILERS